MSEPKPGIYLALVPDYGFDQSLVGLDVHLINGLSDEISYYYDIQLEDGTQETYEGEIPAGDLMHMSHLYFGQLNGGPSILVECEVWHGGKKQRVEKCIRLKPQVIHKGPKYSALLLEDAFVYDVFLQKDLPPAPTKVPTPKKKLELDVQLLKHFMTENASSGKDQLDISKADYELDLHFEKLVKNESSFNGDKLHYQLETFQHKLDSAIANGLHSMVVIHGVGSGRLKEEVGNILRANPRVKSFGPCMHRKYGFGATEIFF